MAEPMSEKYREKWERWWMRHNARLHKLGLHKSVPELFCPRCPAMRVS